MPFALDDIRAQLVGLKTCDTCDNIEFLLNTHWHVDHVSNNAYFGEHDTTIIAHDNVRGLLSSPQEQPEFGLKLEKYPEEALPVVTFEESVFVYFNDEQIQVIHQPNGHTNSDSIVYFTESKVLHLGDHFFAGMFPYVDLGHGGSVQGLTDNVGKIIDEFPEDVKIIPGHGPLAEMEDLVEYHSMLVETTKIVQDQIEKGKTLEEIQEAKVLENYQKWNGLFIDEATWIMIVYNSLMMEPISDQKQCQVSGGLWGVWTNTYEAVEQCNPSTTDSGIECTDSSQCQSYCQAKEGSEINTEDTGLCHGFQLAICMQEVRNGLVQPEWCQ